MTHGSRVSDIAEALARVAGYPPAGIPDLRMAALYHDVGKRYLPHAVIAKPGPLTDRERRIVERHPELGARHVLCLDGALGQAKSLAEAVCRQHHERWDGQGYPLGLPKKAIRLEARIVALADVIEALASDRCYRPAWDWPKIKVYVATQAGKMFDPFFVEAFLYLQADLQSILLPRCRRRV